MDSNNSKNDIEFDRQAEEEGEVIIMQRPEPVRDIGSTLAHDLFRIAKRVPKIKTYT